MDNVILRQYVTSRHIAMSNKLAKKLFMSHFAYNNVPEDRLVSLARILRLKMELVESPCSIRRPLELVSPEPTSRAAWPPTVLHTQI